MQHNSFCNFKSYKYITYQSLKPTNSLLHIYQRKYNGISSFQYIKDSLESIIIFIYLCAMLEESIEDQTQVRILNKRRIHGNLEYLVLWQRNDQNQANWEPITNLRSCLSAIQSYESSLSKSIHVQSRKKERKNKKLDFSKIFALPEDHEANRFQKIQTHEIDNQLMKVGSQKRSLREEDSVQNTLALRSSKKLKQNQKIFAKTENRSIQIQIIEQEEPEQKFKQIQDLLSKRTKQQQQIQHQLSKKIEKNAHTKITQQNQLYENVCHDLSALDNSRKQSISNLTVAKRNNNSYQNIHKEAYLQKQLYQELILAKYYRQIKCEQQLVYIYKMELTKKRNQDPVGPSDHNQIQIICIQDIMLLSAQLKQFQVKKRDMLFSKVLFLVKHKYGWIVLGVNQFNQNMVSEINDLSEAEWVNLQASFHQY